MSRVQEYLKNKKIKEMGLPKMYIVKSTPDGVEQILERQVVEINEGAVICHMADGKVPKDRYKLDDTGFPFEVYILKGGNSGQESAYGSGLGDLWAWTYFHTLSKEEAESYYEKEVVRVREKYQIGKQNPSWVNPSDKLPTESEWTICYVQGNRIPLKYNKHNLFWVGLDGKTYKAQGVDKWLDA